MVKFDKVERLVFHLHTGFDMWKSAGWFCQTEPYVGLPFYMQDIYYHFPFQQYDYWRHEHWIFEVVKRPVKVQPVQPVLFEVSSKHKQTTLF